MEWSDHVQLLLLFKDCVKFLAFKQCFEDFMNTVCSAKIWMIVQCSHIFGERNYVMRLDLVEIFVYFS